MAAHHSRTLALRLLACSLSNIISPLLVSYIFLCVVQRLFAASLLVTSTGSWILILTMKEVLPRRC